MAEENVENKTVTRYHILKAGVILTMCSSWVNKSVKTNQGL